MKIISKKFNFRDKFSSIIQKSFKDYIFFDIETSGFSPKNSSLYMLGFAFFKTDKELYLEQIFLENLSDEKVAFEKFLSLLKNFKYIISFNGNTFDFPFIKTCLSNYALDISVLDSIESIDLYKIAKRLKALFGNNKLNQSSLEKFFYIPRQDKYSGKELINVYQSYITNSQKDEQALKLLLLHNECDVLGLVGLSLLLDLRQILSTKLIFCKYSKSENSLSLSFKTSINFDFNLLSKIDDFKLEIFSNTLILTCPIFSAKLKYFFEKYKDYFYLPAENICIHKDIATFVDKSAKIKASKETAFIEKEGVFFPSFEKNELKIFKKEYKDKNSYFLLEDIDFNLMSEDILKSFIKKYKL